MRPTPTCLLALACLAPLGAAAAPRTPPAIQAQLRRLTEERDSLKQRLAATENLQEELAAAQKSRDLARQDAEAARKELAQMKADFRENQGSGDAMLKELQKAQAELQEARSQAKALRQELDEAGARLKAPAGEGGVALLGRDISPARAVNLRKVTPSVRKVSGAVVVNVLVSENGEVLDVRLVQGVHPGIPVEKEEDVHAKAAHAACLEAAKRLIFDPARTAAGTPVRVWQGIGFFLD